MGKNAEIKYLGEADRYKRLAKKANPVWLVFPKEN